MHGDHLPLFLGLNDGLGHLEVITGFIQKVGFEETNPQIR